jgi:tyrosine-protein kinase
MPDPEMAGNGIGRYSAPELHPDEPLEVGRYFGELRRSWKLIALIVALITGAVLVVSVLLPKTYQATSKIVLQDTSDSLSGDAPSLQRRLATIQILLTTREVLAAAVRRLDGQTERALEGKVHATVDQNANIVSVTATDGNASRAAQIANVVAATFLVRQQRSDRQRLDRARTTIQQALDQLKGATSVEAQTQIGTLRTRLTDLNVQAASNGSELQLAEAAEVPTKPSSPRPVRNAVFAFFGALFIAALVVLARAQIKPRVGGSRELSRMLDLPVLVEVPHVRRSVGRSSPKTLSAIEYEAYQTLQASLRMQLPPTSQRTVLVTSALHGEGKTEVTAALGLVLAQAGQRTWLVSADMRTPRLHELFDVAPTPGLAEVLAGARDRGASEMSAARKDNPRVREPGGGKLHVLASGRRPADPAQLLASEALDYFFEDIKQSDYDYVLLDGPPLLGLVDSQVLAQRVDGVLLVCRPDRLTAESAIATRELLERLRVRALGLVVIGGRGSPPYFEA